MKKAFIAIILLWCIAFTVLFYIFHITPASSYIDFFQKSTDKTVKDSGILHPVSDNSYLYSGNYNFSGTFSIINTDHNNLHTKYLSTQIGVIIFLVFYILIISKIFRLSSIKRKSKFWVSKKYITFLFVILFFFPLSSQVFVKDGAVLSIKNSAFHSDSITYENERKNNSREEISGTIYIVQGTYIYNLKENTNLKLEYISKKDSIPSKRQKPHNDISKKSLTKKVTNNIPKVAYKKKNRFLYNPFSDNNLNSNTNRGTGVAVISNIPTKNNIYGILRKNSIHPYISNYNTISTTFLCEKFIISFFLNSYTIRPPPFFDFIA